jgi:hypothetical protein
MAHEMKGRREDEGEIRRWVEGVIYCSTLWGFQWQKRKGRREDEGDERWGIVPRRWVEDDVKPFNLPWESQCSTHENEGAEEDRRECREDKEVSGGDAVHQFISMGVPMAHETKQEGE